MLSNIAEGFEEGGDKEFRQFLSIAKGSISELKAQLYVTSDVGFLGKQEFEELYSLAGRTGQVVGGLMRYLGRSDLDGVKYKPAQPPSRP